MKISLFLKISILYMLLLNIININIILCDKNSKELQIEEDFTGKLYYRLGKIL